MKVYDIGVLLADIVLFFCVFFVKVIEVFIKAEDGLSRDVVKHLNCVSRVFNDSDKDVLSPGTSHVTVKLY